MRKFSVLATATALALIAAGLGVSSQANAQPYEGGMMGDGYGMMGDYYGPGMMYGPGFAHYGMIGGYCGYGPGMMGGYCGYGPSMMGGYYDNGHRYRHYWGRYGHGYGPGMMGSYDR